MSPHHPRRPGAALLLCAIAASVSLWARSPEGAAAQHVPPDVSFAASQRDTDRPLALADGMPVYATHTPPILRPDYTGTVQVEIVYAGTVSQLRVFYQTGATYAFDQFASVETRTLAGRTVTVFRPSWTMAEFQLRFALTTDYDSGIGATLTIAPSTVALLPDGTPTAGDIVTIHAMSVVVGDVPTVQINSTAQYSSHVVNLVVPGYAATLGASDVFDVSEITKQFYSHFGDDYEQLALVFREEPFSRVNSAAHAIAKNTIDGIGLRLADFSADYGSAGRLEGLEIWRHTFNNIGANHELAHQWNDYYGWEAIAGLSRTDVVHSPLWTLFESPVAALAAANLQVQPRGGTEWQAVQAAEPTQIPPLLAYAMGRLPASAVPPIDVFEVQSRPSVNFPGQTLSGTVRRVTIDQVIAQHGPRTGPVVNSVRRATILVSRDALVTPEEMAYWTLQTQRLEDPQQTGMIDEFGIGSFRAISGVTVNTRVIRPSGPVLPGLASIDPEVLDPRDLAGLVLDAGPRRIMSHVGVFRMQGRLVGSGFTGATSIGVRWGGAPIHSTSAVAPDGSFSILDSPQMAVGRYPQEVFVTVGGVTRRIAVVRNIQFYGELRAPLPPVALAATASGGNVSIRWAPDTGSAPSSYVLEVGSATGASNVGSVPVGGTTLAASGVPNGQYFLRVRAANASGISAPSSEVVLSVGCAAPQPPGTLAGSVNGSLVSLQWQPSPTPGASYTIVAGSTSGGSDIAQVPMGAVTSLSAVVPPARYFVRVRAATACGTADSNEVQLLVGVPPAPGAPGGLAHQVSGSKVTLTWQPAAGAVTGYALEAGSLPGLADIVVAPLGNVLSFVADGVPPGTYYVRIRAANPTGQGPPSNEVVVTVP